VQQGRGIWPASLLVFPGCRAERAPRWSGAPRHGVGLPAGFRRAGEGRVASRSARRSGAPAGLPRARWMWGKWTICRCRRGGPRRSWWR